MGLIEHTYQVNVGDFFLIAFRLEPFWRRCVIYLRAYVLPANVHQKVPVHLICNDILFVSHPAHHALLLGVVIQCDF